MRERAIGCRLETFNAIQGGLAEEPQLQNKQRELLKLRGKMAELQAAPAFSSNTVRWARAGCMVNDISCRSGESRPEYARRTVSSSRGYYTF
ncbi:MAG TPA: hypothetical protein VJN89_00400 [Candidatus Acidoferrum sp.]|nr:hypothetical protein [Candidatus Acidoferrum sp.]